MTSVAASLLPNSMNRPHVTSDSRLLQNLIECERKYTQNLDRTVQSSGAAAAALKAWGTTFATSTSSRLADLLHEVAEAQNYHLEAIKGYREALKDVADREASIRTIVKDRDILVSRLIKASKKNGDVEHAQRELTSCEEVLEAEERALVGVKRRTFKEALSMRMKTMGDAGNTMIETAKEAILLLDDFDQHAGGEEARSYNGDAYYDAQQDDYSIGPDAANGAYQYQQQPGQAYSQDTHAQHIPEAPASVTPSQSASQTAHGTHISNAAGGYTRPGFASGAPNEVAEEQAGADDDSDASSEAGALQQSQRQERHVNNGHYGAAAAAEPAMPSAQSAAAQAPSAPPPQMYSATAPRFNYDGAQLAPIPQAPRLYQRGDDEASSDTEQPRGAQRSGWGSNRQRTTGGGDDDSSGDEGPGYTSPRPSAREAAKSGRPQNQKRGSFLGKVSKLFKTGVSDNAAATPSKDGKGHRRGESAGDSSIMSSRWDTRTDKNMKDARNQDLRASGQAGSQTLFRSMSGRQTAADEISDDEDDRRDLVRVVNNPQSLFSGNNKPGSQVGKTLRRTPSEIARITAGPMSTKQKREIEAQLEEENRQAAQAAVIGAGIGGQRRTADTPERASTIKSTTSQKKKKTKRTPSIAGSEIGTSATRQQAPAPALPTSASSGLQRHSSYIVKGDSSSGSRGLASLVLPSDLGKERPYPSIMPPTGLTPGNGPGAGLSRSNSTVTNATGKAVSTTSKKKKKRQSAIAEGPGTGLTAMSPKDSGKYTTSSWVPPHQQVGGGPTAQAVAHAGQVAHTPASSVDIARRQTMSSSNAAAGASIPRPLSPQSTGGSVSLPLKSAMRPKQQSGPTPSLGSAVASLGSVASAPPAASAVLAEQQHQQPAPVSTNPPQLPNIPEQAGEGGGSLSQAAQPSLTADEGFDGTGHLDMSMSQTESAEAAPAANAERAPIPLPHIDMPESEPLGFDMGNYDRGDGAKGSRPVTPGGAGDPNLLTPGERGAYEQFLGPSSAGNNAGAPQQEAPSVATQPGPEPTRVLAERHRIGGDEPEQESKVGAPVPQTSASVAQPAEEASVAAEPAAPAPTPAAPVEEPAGRDSLDAMPKPSRTYSSEGKAIHTPRSHAPAPAHSSLRHAHLAPTAGAGGVGSVGSDVSTASGGVSRRKSVRMAPDVKLPPETPPIDQSSSRHDGLVSDSTLR